MAHTLYDIKGLVVTHQNLQLRGPWYLHGERKEAVFVQLHGTSLGVAINPAKESDPSAPDLVENNALGDLKCQNTPFFSAKKYNCTAQHTVTFNVKDAFAYQKYLNDPSFAIFFWVDWAAVKMSSERYSDTIVNPMSGVWRIEFRDLDQIRRQSPIHWYNERARQKVASPQLAAKLALFEPRLKEGEDVFADRSVNGGNAACSYLIDLNRLIKVI